ncbi:MAG: DinB family protein [Acidimicrobiales bacterium]|jgi:hypothetical protein
MTNERTVEDIERADLLETLATHRSLLRRTVRDLTDSQARERSTVSELCLGGVIKHVTRMEQRWADFVVRGPAEGGVDLEAHAASFRMLEDETLAGLLEKYDATARRTDELVASLGSLDDSQPLPAAAWFPPGARWSARRVVLHVIAETAQHAGHADIIRESLDGAKTMG